MSEKRQASYDWIGKGKPKRNPNGTYSMKNESGAFYAFTPKTIDNVRDLLDEIELIHLKDK